MLSCRSHDQHPLMPASLRGWGLVELLAGLALTGLLSTLAWPSYEAQLQRLRRADGQVALARLQQAREQLHSRTAAFAPEPGESLPTWPSRSEDGHYLLSVAASTGSSADYRIEAVAVGRQAGDIACRYLAIEQVHGQFRRRSGPDALLGNDAAGNRRCWGRW